MTLSESPPMPAEARIDAHPSRLDSLAAWILRGPLSVAVVLLAAMQLVTWVPHYLTWPWFADHDVFATAAQAWDAGQKPYRDVYGNNFPGTIYLFWILGKLFGWGKTSTLFAADSALVVAFGTLMLAWSRRRFGRILPGAIGFLTFLGYYLGLDYSQVAQRDWHGPCFAVVAVLIAQAWPGRIGRLTSALAMATALVIRPQPVLLLPALVLALADGSTDRRDGPAKVLLSGLEWGVVCAIFLALAFAPLVWAGVLPDFVRGVRLAAYGGNYNKASAASFLKESLIQIAPLRIVAVLAAIGLLMGRAGRSDRRAAITWLVALAGVLLYKPISPLPHAYLNHPLMLVWSVSVAVLVQLALEPAI
ncbi:MAG TPA: hypothetical protein VGZ22_07230, partial [Isosphaeraceae bacterium]|nr:hypothetical protein [Isosphaeraceae bacterium]